ASSIVQHPRLPVRSVPPARDSARWTPVTSCPASTARAAATAESTPPLIAARIRMSPVYERSPGRGPDEGRSAVPGRASVHVADHGGHRVDVLVRRRPPETEPQHAPRLRLRAPERLDDVGRLGDPRLAGGSRG